VGRSFSPHLGTPPPSSRKPHGGWFLFLEKRLYRLALSLVRSALPPRRSFPLFFFYRGPPIFSFDPSGQLFFLGSPLGFPPQLMTPPPHQFPHPKFSKKFCGTRSPRGGRAPPPEQEEGVPFCSKKVENNARFSFFGGIYAEVRGMLRAQDALQAFRLVSPWPFQTTSCSFSFPRNLPHFFWQGPFLRNF